MDVNITSNLIWPKIVDIMNSFNTFIFRYENTYFLLLLKILFFFDCFNMGLIWPFSSARFSRSLAFNVKLETEDDDFISPFDLWNVSCCKIKLILIILNMLYAWWECTDPVFCNENKKIRCFWQDPIVVDWIKKRW